jgi:hypothetical protein
MGMQYLHAQNCMHGDLKVRPCLSPEPNSRSRLINPIGDERSRGR